MEWVPLTDYEIGINLNDQPRKLTDEEIAYITAHLPTAPSADSTAAEVSRQGTIEWMVETLKEVNMAPSAIPELIQRIVEQHNRSLVVPGTPVGITAAEAVGATTTQMTLNTFHTSGSAKSASFGIDAMRDLIFARKNPKNESCTIYFTNKTATYEEVLDSRQYIVGSVVADFIKDYDIDSPAVLERYWWHDTVDVLLEKQLPESTKVLRLFLNVPEMYKHKVSIKDLADVLEREVPPSAVAIYGPIADGIIDLYPHPTIIADTLKGKEKGAIPTELAELTYLETVVWPELKNIRVKGISGIRNLVPVVSPVWRMILLERKLKGTDIRNEQARPMLLPHVTNGSGWILFYNPTIMKMTGLLPENLAALCQLAGLTLVGGTQSYLVVSLPNDRFRTTSNDTVIDLNGIKYRQLNRESIVRQNNDIFREVSETDIVLTDNGWIETIQEEGEKKDGKPEHPKISETVADENIWRVNDKIYRRIPIEQFLEIGDNVYEQIINPNLKIKELKPSEYVSDKVNQSKLQRREDIKVRTDEIIREAQEFPEEVRKAMIRRPVNIPRTPIMIASEFVIAETEGANLKELLALPNIDKTRTTCNNMYTITAALGIEAARTFLIRKLNDTISNTGSYVHPANIMFIAEFITSRGEPYGATYTGISRQPGGHLSLATLERAGKVFTQNALHGRKEDIRNVSASVAVGARMAIGNGAFDIAQNIIEDGVEKTIINDDLFTALERDDETRRLAAVQTATPAEATITPDALLEGINLAKTMAVGGTFDYIGAEDETNLITLFGPGDVAPDIITRQTQTATPRRVVRRVQAETAQQGGATLARTPPVTKVDIPRELVDILAQIKVGIPLPEGEADDRITITPLQTGVTLPIQLPEPVYSTGLIPLTELIPQRMETGIPEGLEALLGRYTAEIQEDELLREPIAQVTVVEELPRTDIPELPDLTGVDFTRTMIDLRREQVRDLQPIDTNALQTALNQ